MCALHQVICPAYSMMVTRRGNNNWKVVVCKEVFFFLHEIFMYQSDVYSVPNVENKLVYKSDYEQDVGKSPFANRNQIQTREIPVLTSGIYQGFIRWQFMLNFLIIIIIKKGSSVPSKTWVQWITEKPENKGLVDLHNIVLWPIL